MDYEAVKKKWDKWISKNLANLQGNVGNKSFLAFYVEYNGFCLKKNRLILWKIATRSFNFGAVIFYKSWHNQFYHIWEQLFCFEPNVP